MLAKIISIFGEEILVKDLENNKQYTAVAKQKLNGHLAVGDNLECKKIERDDKILINKVLERKNFIERPNLYSKKNKLVAANIDQAIIVISVEPAPIEHYIDRYLVALYHAQIKPIIVLNKTDLFTNENKKNIDYILQIYKNLSYQVFEVSALSKTNIKEMFATVLHNKTSIFIGQSGVGKSEILNAILGEVKIITAQISDYNKKGKHTTTVSTLYAIDKQTYIIDSPGIREFGLWHKRTQDIFMGFKEFRELNGNCMYRNCNHTPKAKGCAIVSAVKGGDIAKNRYINYHRLIKKD